MLNDLKIDELLEKVDSRYGVAIAGAKRARQINEYTATLGLNDSLGIPGPQVHTQSQHPLTIAIEELRADKLEVTFKAPRDLDTPEQEIVEQEETVLQTDVDTLESETADVEAEAVEAEVVEAEAVEEEAEGSEGQGAA